MQGDGSDALLVIGQRNVRLATDQIPQSDSAVVTARYYLYRYEGWGDTYKRMLGWSSVCSMERWTEYCRIYAMY